MVRENLLYLFTSDEIMSRFIQYPLFSLLNYMLKLQCNTKTNATLNLIMSLNVKVNFRETNIITFENKFKLENVRFLFNDSIGLQLNVWYIHIHLIVVHVINKKIINILQSSVMYVYAWWYFASWNQYRHEMKKLPFRKSIQVLGK